MKVNFPSLLGLPSEQRKIFDFVRQRLQNGLTIADNQFATLLDFSFDREAELTHGTETQFKNPLRSVPIGFEPIYAEDANGDALEIPRCKLNKRPLGGDGEVRDGYLGITPEFDLQHTQPYLEKYLTSNFSVGNNSDTTILWDSTGTSRSSIISYNAGTFTVSEAGTYQILLVVPWQTGVTYTALQAYVRIISGSAGGYAANLTMGNFYPVAWTEGAFISCSAQVRLLAGATFDLRAYQTNGAAAARSIRGTATSGVTPGYASITRAYNDTIQSGRVIGILWGA